MKIEILQPVKLSKDAVEHTKNSTEEFVLYNKGDILINVDDNFYKKYKEHPDLIKIIEKPIEKPKKKTTKKSTKKEPTKEIENSIEDGR